MVRFLHTADWQIGITRRHLDAEAQARFAAARRNFRVKRKNAP